MQAACGQSKQNSKKSTKFDFAFRETKTEGSAK